MLVKTKEFLSGVRAEVKKVTWPSRQEAVGGTMVVFVMVSLIATFLWGIDSLLSFLVKSLIAG